METTDGGVVGGSWLSPGEDEYDAVCHGLKLSIADGRVPIDIEIWAIDQPQVTEQYQQRTRSLLKLNSWLNPDHLEEINSVRNVCVRGTLMFPSPSNGLIGSGLSASHGMEFHTGILTNLPNTLRVSEKKQCLLLAEIAVGKSLVKDDIKKCSVVLPQGYDSYYITDHLLDRNQDGAFSLVEYQEAAAFDHRDPRYYHHRYFLTDSSLVLPKYIVRFHLPPLSSFLPSNSPVKITRGIVSNNGLSNSMNNGGMNGGVTNFLATEYFDMTNFKPLSKLERDQCNDAEVRVYSIDDAYERACVELNFPDPLVSGKLEWIEKQLDMTEERVRLVNLNYAEIADKLFEEYNKAKSALNAITQRKLETILSAEIDLRRQKEQLLWAQSFANNEITRADNVISGKVGGSASFAEKKEAKLELLRTWKCQVAMRNELGRLRDSKPNARALHSVKPDTRAYISINIVDGKKKEGEESAMTTPMGGKMVMVRGDVVGANGENSSSRLGRQPRADPPASNGYGSDDSSVDNKWSDDEESDAEQGVQAAKSLLFPVYYNDSSAEATAAARELRLRSQQVPASYQQFIEQQTRKIKAILVEKSRIAEEYFTNQECLPLPSSVFRHGGVLGEKYCVNVPSSVIIPAVPPGETRDVIRDSSSAIVNSQRRVYVDPKALFKDVLRSHVDPSSSGYFPDQTAGDVSTDSRRNQGISKHTSSPGASIQPEQQAVNVPPSPPALSSAASISNTSVSRSVYGSERGTSSPLQRNVQPSMVAGNKISSITVATSNLSPSAAKSPTRPAPRYSTSSSISSASHGRKPLVYKSSGTSSGGSGGGGAPSNLTKIQLEKQALAQSKLETVVEERASQADEFDSRSLLENEGFEASSVYSLSRVTVPLATLRKIAVQYPQLSMRSIADRKISQLISRRIANYDENVAEFRNSNILARTEAEAIYFCLPFLTKPPLARLLYSTGLHSRSLHELYMKNVSHRGPCLMVIRSGDFVFGGYFSHPLLLSGAWSGGPACFLFSVTLDLKIPFHARSLPAECNGELDAFIAERDLLTIGNNDLVIGNAIREGESDLEHVFGVGLEMESPEARCLLAGRSQFTIDDLEVWAITI